MNIEFQDFRKYQVQASDGELGKVSDVIFDDRSFAVRYLVVDTSKWLSGRKVLLSPESCSNVNQEKTEISFSLTKEEIKSSPPSDIETTITRKYEESLHQFYGWAPYWNIGPVGGPWFPYPSYDISNDMMSSSKKNPEAWKRAYVHRKNKSDVHLVSSADVRGLAIHTIDEEIFGEVEDLIINRSDWQVIDLILSSRKWLPGGRLFTCSPMFISNLNITERKLKVDLARDTLMNSPEYNFQDYGASFHARVVKHYLKSGGVVSEKQREQTMQSGM